MNSKIFIPKKIKAGFNKRNDTFTGKLAYVIAWDGKKWRKETSWEGWREKYLSKSEIEDKRVANYHEKVASNTRYYNNDVERGRDIIADPKKYVAAQFSHNHYGGMYNQTAKDNWEREAIKGAQDFLDKYPTLEDYLKWQNVGSLENHTFRIHNVSSDKGIKPVEYENTPTEGFVLNKKVGGKGYSSWDSRATYTRVYDPRGFEFEISIPNLLYILENTNSIKGKGLEGKFVYGWSGKDLVLIPESAPEYKEMMTFTEMQDNKIGVKEMIAGKVYISKQKETLTYLGRFPEWSVSYEYMDGTKTKYHYNNKTLRQEKWTGVKKFWFATSSGSIITKSGLTSISHLQSEDYDNKLGEYLDKMETLSAFSKITLRNLEPLTQQELDLDKSYSTYYFTYNNVNYSFIYYSSKHLGNYTNSYGSMHSLNYLKNDFITSTTVSNYDNVFEAIGVNKTGRYTLKELNNIIPLKKLVTYLENGKIEK